MIDRLDTPVFALERGTRPLLVSMPHVGTALPPEVAARLGDAGPVLQDTDWHLDRLYDFAAALGASVLRAKVSRYAIDLNRPPTGESLYPGRTTTGLCPTETFRGVPLYRDGRPPDAAEVARRLDAYWRPYHEALAAELERLRTAHGDVLLWEAHSIASELPRLFEGRLPDLNFGTADGASCDAALADAVIGVARGSPFSVVRDGRFKGGWITRRHGAPGRGVHAIQLELVQALYMDEAAPFDWLPATAARVQPWLRRMLETGLGHVEAAGAARRAR